MKKRIIKTVAASALAALMLASSGCASFKREYTRIDGKSIEFASEYETEKWREPLERLLSNTVDREYWDETAENFVEKGPAYPDRPWIEKGKGCALFDFTGDGVPELLVDMGGGSAGNAPYEVYDIYTGENIGFHESSPGDAICCYYDREEEKTEVVSKYYWRSGWSSKLFFTSFIRPCEGGFEEKLYLYAGYSMEHEYTGEDDFYTVCSSMDCSIWEERADPEWYLAERDYFDTRYIRIPETALEYVSWFDVKEKGDSHDELGEKMADVLLSTEQKFIVYNE